MTAIPIARGDFDRRVAEAAAVVMKNRFIEQVPVLTDRPVSAISRPALKRFAVVGVGPIRHVFSAPGAFDDDAFVVSGFDLYRVSAADGTSSFIGTISTTGLGGVSMAVVARIGDIPTRLFIAEGGVLWIYTENGEATGHLQASAIANGDQVRIGDTYYQFTTGAVDTGTPAGTAIAPWLVKSVGVIATDMTNLFNAINDEGIPGTDYSTLTTAHPTVRASILSGGDLYVAAKAPGAAGNAIVTTETGAGLIWAAATLTGGGGPTLRQAGTPDGIGAVSIAGINSYVIVVPVQADDLETVGRFYWINPGETYVDPIDFATAERSQDKLHQVGVYSDKFWLFGQITTEPWITVGGTDAPMQRFQGILFDRGSWEGTAVQVKDSLVVVDEDGGVFQIAGGQKRISRPDIEERIRAAMQLQKFADLT